MSHPTLTLPDDMTIESLRPALWLTAGRGVGTTGARSLAQARGEQFQGAIVAGHALKDLAMSAWVYPVSSPSIQSPFIFYTGGNGPTYPGMCLRQSQTSRYPMMYFATGVDGTNEYIQKATSMPLNAWTHIFGYVDRANKVLYLYVNGVLANSASFSGNGSSFDLSSYMAIGGMSGLPSEYRYDGRISRCGYFIGTLDHAAAAQHLYNQGNGRFWAEVTQADLIAAGKHYYNLNETQLSSAIDAIGTNDLAISGYNLLANPGFETLGAGGADVFGTWVEASAGASTISADTGRTGSYSCLLTVDGSGSLAQVTQPSAVITGRKYAYSCYAKSSPSGRDLVITDGLGTWGIHTLTASWAQYSGTAVAGFTSFVFKRSGTLTESLWIDDMSLTSAQIDSAVGPREAMAADLVGGYHGLLTNMDAVSSWSTDTPDGSYTASKLDSVGTAHGTMTGFTDVDAAHVDGPDGSWGPHIPNDGSDGASIDGWLLSSVKDSRSASVPSSLNTRIFDEYYTEPTSTGSRCLASASDQLFAMDSSPVYGTGDVTLEAWVYPTTASAGGYIFGTGGNSVASTGINLMWSATGSYIRSYASDGTTQAYAVSSVILQAYKWTHLVSVINRTAGTITIYQDGAIVGVQNTIPVGSYTPGPTHKAIGAYFTGDATYNWEGGLAFARISEGYAYTPADIAESYNGGKGRKFSELGATLAGHVTYAWDLGGAGNTNETAEKGGNNLTQTGASTNIASGASVYLPAYDCTLTGFTSSPRSSDVPTALVGKCKSLQGATDKYATTGTKTVTGMGARSVAFWFKRNGNPAANEFIINESQTSIGAGFRIYMGTDGRIQCSIGNGAATIVSDGSLYSNAGFADNAWHHCVMTWDGTTTASKAIIYIDGSPNGNPATASATNQGGASQYALQLFGINGTAVTEFLGLLCRPQVFAGRALTAGEVATLYAGGDVTEGLTAEWRFNEPDSITVPFEHSLECDGANTAVECGTVFASGGDRTISAWIYVDAAGEGGVGRIVDDGKTVIYSISTAQFRLSFDGVTTYTTTTAESTSGWAHIAITVSSTGFAQVYYNGRRMALYTLQSNNAGVPVAGTSPLRIGNNNSQSASFDGRIGQVRIDSGVLTQAQIRQLAMGQSPATPKASWQFDKPLDLPYLSGCKAVRFDGVDDYITAPTGAALLNGASQAMVAFWMYPPVGDAGLPVRFERVSDSTRFGIILASNGTVTVAVRSANEASAQTAASAAGALVPGVWNHIAFGVNLATATATLYVNGVAVSLTGTLTLTQTTFEEVASGLFLGSAPNGLNWVANDLADVRIFVGSIPTQSQIRSLITGTDFRTGISAQWKFGETPRSIPSCAGGYSLEFDGSDDTVRSDSDPIGTGNVTISAWIKPDGLGGGSFGRIADNGRTLFYLGGGNILRLSSDGGTTDATSTASSIPIDGAWHHVAATRSAAGTVAFYVDGVDKTSNPTSGTTGSATATFCIGGRSVDNTRNFDGNIDDVRMYGVILSAPDIAILAAGGEPTTNPTAHWPLDDGPQYGEPSNGDPINVWESKDGNRISFAQTNHSACPTYLQSGQNGRPGIGFDSANSQYLESLQAIANDPYGTIVIVGKANAISSNMTWFGSADKATSSYYTSVETAFSSGRTRLAQRNNDTSDIIDSTNGVGTSTAKIIAVRSDGSAIAHRINGAQETVVVTGGANRGDWFGDTANRDNTFVGAMVYNSIYQPLKGVIYEILYWPRPLADAELRRVEKILAATYGITLAS